MTQTETTVKHILVADDEAHIGRIIKIKMEQGPFNVILAFDGQEAVDALDAEPALDLVVLDLMMPRLSGLDVLDRIRSSEKWKELPCIILTAAGQEEYEREARSSGATDFITKPFSPKKLYSLIARLTGVASDDLVAESETTAND
ncbi:MAG TPA: response regulator transcription factor [Gemmatimonadaceae bacterium]|nr:response regulator transcription factor [Gemmatimonadaceae bacterium]